MLSCVLKTDEGEGSLRQFKRLQILYDIIGQDFKAIPGLSGRRQNELRRQFKTVAACVAQFHGVGMDDAYIIVVVIGAHSGSHVCQVRKRCQWGTRTCTEISAANLHSVFDVDP